MPSASPGDVSVEAAPEARPQLSAARLQRVQALFAEWDVGGAGRFEIAGFEKQSTMKVGPHESQLLARLGDMDVDGDGYITKEEWQDYFGSAAAALKDDEFDIILDELASAGANAVAIQRSVRAAGADGAPPAAGDDDEGAAPTPALPKARKALVDELFAVWDFDKKGAISREAAGSAAMSAGPVATQPLKYLEEMDADGDNQVTYDEMLGFFTLASPQLGDVDFSTIIDSLMEVAETAAVVASAVKAAEPRPVAASDDGGGGAPSAAPLAAGRSAALRELFDVFKPTDGAIALAGLAGVNMKAGAAEIKLLKELGDMDFDGDGLLTFDEMCGYFAQVGTALNDEEFDLIVEEMRTAATAYALAMTLQE